MQYQEEDIYTKSFDLGPWKKLIRLAKPFNKYLLGIIFTAAFVAVIEVIFPLFKKQAIDGFAATGDLSGLLPFILVYVALIVAYGGRGQPVYPPVRACGGGAVPPHPPHRLQALAGVAVFVLRQNLRRIPDCPADQRYPASGRYRGVGAFGRGLVGFLFADRIGSDVHSQLAADADYPGGGAA